VETVYINLLNYSLHIILLIVKLVLIYGLIKKIGIHTSSKNRTMIVYSPLVLLIALFTIIYTLSEVMFINVFDKGIDFYYYEFIAMIDQIILTSLVIANLTKGESNGKN